MTSSDSSETISDDLIIDILEEDERELSFSDVCVVFERLVAWSD